MVLWKHGYLLCFCGASANIHQKGPWSVISAVMTQASWNNNFITARFDFFTFNAWSPPERRLGLTLCIFKLLIARCCPGLWGLLMTGGGRRVWLKKTWSEMMEDLTKFTCIFITLTSFLWLRCEQKEKKVKRKASTVAYCGGIVTMHVVNIESWHSVPDSSPG